MKVTLISYTEEAAELLVFSKRTRHLTGVGAYEEVKQMPEGQLSGELGYVFSTIGSSWEFVDYVFLLEDVTRAFTHQLVRHRVGTAFAQQAQRVADMSKFGYLATGGCKEEAIYHQVMEQIREGYLKLIKKDLRVQDARGVLPTNIYTNILFKVNLRALSHILSVRLCFRAQGEFQDVARLMRREVVAVHPWASSILQVACVQSGVCTWPRYKECPLRIDYPWLSGHHSPSAREDLLQDWEDLVGFDPQPSVHSWEKEG